MEIELFTICNRTSVEDDKISLHQIHNLIEVLFTPVQNQSLTIVTRIRYSQNEYGRHIIKFIFTNPFDKEMPVKRTDNFLVRPSREFSFETGFTENTRVHDFSSLTFPDFGVYKIHLLIDNREVGVLPYIVTQASKLPSSFIKNY